MGYTNPFFNVRTVSGGYKIYPDGISTDDLYIYANPVDTTPNITLLGGGNLYIAVPTTGYIVFRDGPSNGMLAIRHLDDDVILEGSATGLTNHNIHLSPNGTGKVKFGTWTADGTSPHPNGSIAILDASGTARKLATIA